MKQFLLLKGLFLSFALMISASVSAYDFEVDGINYYCESSSSTTVSVASLSSGKYSGKIVIPSSVRYNGEKYSVTSIGGKAFENCSNLTSVSIPKSVTYIGGYAFYGCSKLTQIVIPESAPSVSDYVFYGCSSLEKVTIPNSVTLIGYSSFENCSSLTSITIPNSVTRINDKAFKGCI